MKVLVFLVLVFVTGCNGGNDRHASNNQVEMVQHAYWDYVQKSTETPKDYLWDIKHSSTGQYLCSLITHKVEIILNFFRHIYGHLVLWTNGFFHKVCHEIDHLHYHLEYFLFHLEDDIHQHTKELAAQIRCKLAELKKCAAHYIDALDPKGLKVALLKKTQELHVYLDECFVHLPTHHHHHHHQHHGRFKLWYKLFGHHRHDHKDNHDHQDDHHDDHHHHHEDQDHHHDQHDHHHHHGRKHNLKKVYGSLEKFKVTLFSLVYRFEVKLSHTTFELNGKSVSRRKRQWGKLNKDSDKLKNELETLWEEWAQIQEKAD